jgi:hypothetical protein
MKKRRWPLWRDDWREAWELHRAIKAGLQVSARNYRRSYPRAEEPWQLAEDRRLLRLVAKHAPKLDGLRLWVTVARALKRTTSAVQTRHGALLAGMRVGGKR